MENEQSSASLWANPDSFSPLLDKARQFAGEYLDTLEKRPVFPTEDSLKAMNMLDLVKVTALPSVVTRRTCDQPRSKSQSNLRV